MSDVKIKVDAMEKSGDNLTPEEKQRRSNDWINYVKGEVNALIDIYKDNLVSGNVGIRYVNPVIRKHKSYEERDENKVSGVVIIVNFEFENVIDKPAGA